MRKQEERREDITFGEIQGISQRCEAYLYQNLFSKKLDGRDEEIA